MGETLARLRPDGVPVADYMDGGELDPVLSPRPYPHPVRTIGWRDDRGGGRAHRTQLGRARGMRALVADGVLDDETARAWADR